MNYGILATRETYMSVLTGNGSVEVADRGNYVEGDYVTLIPPRNYTDDQAPAVPLVRRIKTILEYFKFGRSDGTYVLVLDGVNFSSWVLGSLYAHYKENNQYLWVALSVPEDEASEILSTGFAKRNQRSFGDRWKLTFSGRRYVESRL